MLDLVRARGCSAIVAWAPDRLHRSPRELEDFIDLLDRYGVAVETVQSGHWDLSTPGGRLVARQLGSVARFESEHKRERVRAAMEQRAAQGKPHGRCPYGWDRQGNRDVVVPEHQQVVAEISRRIVGGDSLRSIAADLTDRGEPTPRDVETPAESRTGREGQPAPGHLHLGTDGGTHPGHSGRATPACSSAATRKPAGARSSATAPTWSR